MKHLVIFVIVIAVGMKFGVVPNPFSSEPNFSGLPTNSVVLYSTEWCGYCRKAREFMSDNDITFIEFDIEKSKEGKAHYDQLKGRGVPLVLVNKELVRGYNPQRIKQLAENL